MVRAVGITEAIITLVGISTAVWWLIGVAGRKAGQRRQAREARRYIGRHH